MRLGVVPGGAMVMWMTYARGIVWGATAGMVAWIVLGGPDVPEVWFVVCVGLGVTR